MAKYKVTVQAMVEKTYVIKARGKLAAEFQAIDEFREDHPGSNRGEYSRARLVRKKKRS